jgi:hypothetical protein
MLVRHHRHPQYYFQQRFLLRLPRRHRHLPKYLRYKRHHYYHTPQFLIQEILIERQRRPLNPQFRLYLDLHYLCRSHQIRLLVQ